MITFDSNQESTSSRIDPDLIATIEDEVDIDSEPLGCGDLWFWGRGNESGKLDTTVGMEFKKSPGDLIASLGDKRIPTQLVKMIAEYDVSYLVIEGWEKINPDTGALLRQTTWDDPEATHKERDPESGNWTTWKDTGFSWHYLNSTLLRFERAGGRVRRVADTTELAAFVLSTYHAYRKEGHTVELLSRTKDVDPFPAKTDKTGKSVKSKDAIDWVLSGDNEAFQLYWRLGIGPARAMFLSREYPTVASIMALGSVEMLAGLVYNVGTGRRFGPSAAKKVWRFIYGE